MNKTKMIPNTPPIQLTLSQTGRQPSPRTHNRRKSFTSQRMLQRKPRQQPTINTQGRLPNSRRPHTQNNCRLEELNRLRYIQQTRRKQRFRFHEKPRCEDRCGVLRCVAHGDETASAEEERRFPDF